jgi:hypothetical protein
VLPSSTYCTPTWSARSIKKAVSGDTARKVDYVLQMFAFPTPALPGSGSKGRPGWTLSRMAPPALCRRTIQYGKGKVNWFLDCNRDKYGILCDYCIFLKVRYIQSTSLIGRVCRTRHAAACLNKAHKEGDIHDETK